MINVTTSSAAPGAVVAPTNCSNWRTIPVISSTADTRSPTSGANPEWRQSNLDTLEPHSSTGIVRATPKHTGSSG
ncbi:hypothetical protein GCM10027203_16310 [Nonomuraea fastidiosa]